MALIPFPNLPKSAGIPAIPRSPNFPPIAAAVLGMVQGALWRALQIQTKWGIFDKNGKALADPSKFSGVLGSIVGALGLPGSVTVSTSGLEYSKEMRVSDFPIEKGSFASYNKVELPATPLVTMAMSGSESDRKKFLEALDKATKSTDLFSVVTPEVTYLKYSIERYAYQRRAQRGATLLVVDISLREIREVSARYAQTGAAAKVEAPKKVDATPPADNGKIEPKPREQSTLKAASDKFVPADPNVAGSGSQPLTNPDGSITSGSGQTYDAGGSSKADGTAATSTKASRFAEMKF
jgi:hypothetical protein